MGFFQTRARAWAGGGRGRGRGEVADEKGEHTRLGVFIKALIWRYTYLAKHLLQFDIIHSLSQSKREGRNAKSKPLAIPSPLGRPSLSLLDQVH